MISVNVKLYIVSNLTLMFACDYDFSERWFISASTHTAKQQQ